MRFFYPLTILVILFILSISNTIAASANPGNEDPKTLKSYLPLNGSHLVNGNEENPVLIALRLGENETIQLDGRLDEEIWSRAQAAVGFTQRSPDDGSPASEPTEARIIYTNNEIYIGIIAYDSSPDSIAATLFRRDANDYSDWVYVSIDSYNDRRTAFSFAVNPRGVQKDILYFNDDDEDLLWDAVWEAKTEIHELGWTAEIRIPLSQLRFSNSESVQQWGVNFQRRLARNQEIAFWAPNPQSKSALVSTFGRLEGIENLSQPLRLEITPYISQSLTRAPGIKANPYYNANDWTSRLGGDIKYGITSDLTLTATINPDFGQVEADPATINLSAFETFFQERRPFFLEGNEIFSFGNTRTYNTWGNPLTFYSRRIGRQPQGNFNRHNNYIGTHFSGSDDIYLDIPNQTTIISAAKLSGKTRDGWSIGFLDAITSREKGRFSINPNNENHTGNFVVEPATNYLVGRVKKDFNEGGTSFGGFISAVNRPEIESTYFEDYLHKSGYLSGLDFEHRFGSKNYVASGTVSYSRVNGSKSAIERTQLSSARFYNRVDSDYLSLDPEKTSLGGFATEVSIQKNGGNNHRYSVTYSDASPGYETNDLGFQNRADYRAIATSWIYIQPNSKKVRYWEVWNANSFVWNYDGDYIGHYHTLGAYTQFNNLWSINMNLNAQPFLTYNDRLTRGGPVVERPESFNFNININSNQTKKFFFNVGTYNRWEATTPEYDHYYWTTLNYRPTTYIRLSVGPEIGFEKDVDQYVTTVQDAGAVQTYGRRYVFADIRQVNLSAPIRLNWTFSPTMSLQTYMRPFIASGDYIRYKELARPRSFDFNVYGQDTGTITENSDGSITVNPDGLDNSNSFTFGKQDFNFRSVQGNAVFRWEYKPGSTLFLVWQQQRDDSASDGHFNFRDDLSSVFTSTPTNIFLIKFAYWFSS